MVVSGGLKLKLLDKLAVGCTWEVTASAGCDDSVVYPGGGDTGI